MLAVSQGALVVAATIWRATQMAQIDRERVLAASSFPTNLEP
jgi:hypothetical protein